jgi:hypothetical protein
MQADGWNDAYITELEQHVQGMQNFGVSALLTQTLIRQNEHDGYLLSPPNRSDRAFGSLRGANSAVAAFERYIDAKFGSDKYDIIPLIVGYAKGVRASSWAEMVQVVKEFLVRQRNVPHSGYFWKAVSHQPKEWQTAVTDIQTFRNKILGLPPGGDRAAQDLNLRRAVVTWHAFTQELLRCTAFLGNDQVNETVTVVRTESEDALKYFKRLNDVSLTEEEMKAPSTVYNVDLKCVRGALESSSLYTIKFIHGNIVTESVVPHHRIFALYMTGQPSSTAHELSFFENDSENEVSFMPEGLPFKIKSEKELAVAHPAKAFSIDDL